MVEAMAWCEVGHEMVEEEGIVRAVMAAMEENETQAVMWEHIKMAAGADKTCRDLVMAFRAGFPEKKSMLEEGLWPSFSMKDELYEVEQVPFLHGRMMIPGCRRKVLDIRNMAHQGSVGM